MINNKSIINIDCGTDAETVPGERTNTHFFWPVSKVVPLKFDWVAPENKKFLIIFTSQNAARIFFEQNSLRMQNVKCEKKWRNCVGFGAVGKKTAQYLQIQLQKFNQLFSDRPVFFPTQEKGLLPLLILLKDNLTQEQEIHCDIFTAKNGRTVQTLTQFEKQFFTLNHKVIDVYKLESMGEKENNIILDKLFKETKSITHAQYVFHCYSGHILTQTANALFCYFNVTSLDDLPSNVFFSACANSAKEALEKLESSHETIMSTV